MSSLVPPGTPQGAKLTEEEQKLVARVFSDPTYFPIEFRTWLKNYIQDAGITVAASQIRGSGGTATRTNLPPGLFVFCASLSAVPLDCLVCDFTAYSRTTYDVLFAKIGTSWGPGDGSTTFNVPDARDRAPFGAGAAIGVAATDGQAYGSRSGARHRHSVNQTPHAHYIDAFSHAYGTWLTEGDQTLNTAQTNDFGSTPNNANVGLAKGENANITVGPNGTNVDAPNFMGVIVAITTGKAA